MSDLSMSYEQKALNSLIRKMRLKELIDSAKRLETSLDNMTVEESLQAICDLIQTSDTIQKEGTVEERAEHTTEIVMDAQVLRINHELVSRVLKKNQVFDISMFRISIDKIIHKDDEVNWDHLAEIACGVARTVRIKPTMLGSIEVDIPEQIVKERKKNKKQKLAEEVRPESIDKMERQTKGPEKVVIMQKKLAAYYVENKRQPVPFYKIAIDPKDFMKSVQNIFLLSFLARDNVIAIEKGEHDHPYVRFLTKDERGKQGIETSQSICSLDYNKWKNLIEFYDIQKAVLEIDSEDSSGDETDHR